MDRAIQWVQTHPWAWKWLEEKAVWRANHAFHFSMKGLVEDLREHGDKTKKPGEFWKLDNKLTSSLARIMVDVHPKVKEVIDIRGAG